MNVVAGFPHVVPAVRENPPHNAENFGIALEPRFLLDDRLENLAILGLVVKTMFEVRLRLFEVLGRPVGGYGRPNLYSVREASQNARVSARHRL